MQSDTSELVWVPVPGTENADGKCAEVSRFPSRPPPAPIPPWQPFPTASLPEPLGGFVTSVAVAVGCDESFVALPALSMMASCIGNTRRIRLNGTWTQPAIVWSGVIAYSGDLKSPSFKPLHRPLWGIHRRLHDEYAEATERYDASVEEWKNRTKPRGSVSPAKPKPPVAERVIVGDVTVEALAPILLENWRGVLLHQDELQELFGSFDKYRGGRGSDCAKWNSIHNGEPIVIDRKTGVPRTIYVPRPCVSISGTIQPATLARVLTSEYQDNGLAARFIFARPPRRIQRWTDREVPEAVTSAFENVVDGLRGLAPGEDKAGRPYPVSLRLTPNALDCFIAFVNRHGQEQFDLTGPVAAAWSKLKGYAARFALVFQCVRWAAGEAPLDGVDDQSVEAGIVLADWFKNEAERLYAAFGESPEDAESQQLADWIRGKGGAVTPRDLVRGPTRFRGDYEAAEAALNSLVEGGLGSWIEPESTKGGGRPSKRFQLCDAATCDETPSHDSATGGFVAVATVAAPENTSDGPGDGGQDEPRNEAPAAPDDGEDAPILDPVTGEIIPRDRLTAPLIDDLPLDLRPFAEPGDVGSAGHRTHLARIRRTAAAKESV